jgi:Ca-activated chloride channel homolog
MLLRNKLALLLVVVVALAALAVAQAVSTTVQAQSQNVPPTSRPQNQAQPAPPQQQSPAPQQSAPQQPAAAPQQNAPAQDAPNQPGNTVQIPGQQQGQTPQVEREGDEGFVIKTQVANTVLHATVVDDKKHVVNGLTKNDFQVYENGQLQQINSFDRRDVPVAVGIVIDNSGSMRDKRPAVNRAAINFVRSSNPHDEVFIVNFNDEYYLDQDFTDKVPQLQEALDRIESRGGTALYDAVVASAEHLKKEARLEKKVLLVVTDGEDNASRESLEQAIRRLQADNGPTVYTIGILGEEKQRRAKRALSAMSEQTGGVAFFPKDVSEVDSITQEVAHDIRNQYILVYAPTTPKNVGGYRTVRVDAHAPGYKHLIVRTRSGYYPNQQERAANNGAGK